MDHTGWPSIYEEPIFVALRVNSLFNDLRLQLVAKAPFSYGRLLFYKLLRQYQTDISLKGVILGKIILKFQNSILRAYRQVNCVINQRYQVNHSAFGCPCGHLSRLLDLLLLVVV